MSVRETFLDNPMIAEVARMRRRFLDSGRGANVNRAVLALTGLAYGLFLLVVCINAREIEPVSFVFVQTVMFALLAPALAHGAVAGERERRSWDALLVAPISRSQIVAGKFFAILQGLGACWIALLVPALIALMFYRPSGSWEYHTGDFFLAQMVSVSFGVLAAAISFLLSVRAKRAYGALGASVGVLFIWLVVSPFLFAIVAMWTNYFPDMLVYGHPLQAVSSVVTPVGSSAIFDASYDYHTIGAAIPRGAYGIPHVLLYLGAAAALLTWATRTLTVADGDRRAR